MAAAKNTELKVKSILVTQPKPETDKSPYADLAKKHSLKIDFREFIHVEGVASQDFRQQRVNINDYNAIILTSRNAVDHFFRMCTEMRVTVPDSLKYFCISESTAFYLQKYVQYRKRKIFHGKATINDLIEIIRKHKDDKFLYPCTDLSELARLETSVPMCTRKTFQKFWISLKSITLRQFSIALFVAI